MKKIIIGLVIVIIAGISFIVWSSSPTAKGSAGNGIPATLATSSQVTIGTSPVMVMATSSCAARVITTNSNAIYLSFSEYAGQALLNSTSSPFGHFQATGTTVVYDSGLYGCGKITAVSSVSGNDTISDFR